MWEDRGAEAGGDSALLPEAPSTDATAVMEEPSQDTGPGSTDMEEWLSESGHLQGREWFLTIHTKEAWASSVLSKESPTWAPGSHNQTENRLTLLRPLPYSGTNTFNVHLPEEHRLCWDTVSRDARRAPTDGYTRGPVHSCTGKAAKGTTTHLSLLRGEAFATGSLAWLEDTSRVGGDSLASGEDCCRCGTGGPSPRII
ncbi:hypothetical protein CB1_001169003 [Camelus ferus]|nr:hypothetical protein CB1_001169003 [Camelus ferus]